MRLYFVLSGMSELHSLYRRDVKPHDLLGGVAEGLTSAYRNYNLDDCDAAYLVEFVTVTSDFYPELQPYYAEEAGEWLAQVEAGAPV